MITTRRDSISAITTSEITELTSLLERHFFSVTHEQVASDLADKTSIVRFFDGERLIGFTTFAYARLQWENQEIGAVWSGDTIIDPQAWGGALLPAAWLAAVLDCHGQNGQLAWCLICSGVRTWRMMPVFYRCYAPGADAGDLHAVRDELALQRYGSRFDPQSGIVRLPAPQVLRPHLRALPVHLTADPEAVDFFARNPGHEEGDELACATWITPSNLTPTGQRIWRMAQRLRESQ